MADFFDDGDEEDADAVQRPLDAGVLMFHAGTEDALFLFLERHTTNIFATEHDRTEFVLKLVDQFCYTRHWMMHIGDEKASVLNSAILNAKAQSINNHGFIAVELGSYCGYSAAVIARNLSPIEGDMLYCVECNAKCARYTQRLIDLCGLTNRVTILNFPAEAVDKWTQAIAASQHRRQPPQHYQEPVSKVAHPLPASSCSPSSCVQLLFIDHSKDRYLLDLQRILNQGNLLAPGCVVIADNVLFMQPLEEYLRFVRDPKGPFIRSHLVEGTVEYSRDSEPPAGVDIRDGMEISILR